ncbi:MAG: hypothetical protein JST89_20795 [Cyanobacteria bacterium SZAS-4]|nr:hypothetical protein [Cyanobacteria bacterium SZAS-4]
MNLMSPETKNTTATAMDNPMLPLLVVLLAYPTVLVLSTSPALIAVPVAICAYWMLLRKKLFFFAGLLTALCVFRIEWLPFLLIPGLIVGGVRFAGGAALAAVGTFFAMQAMHIPFDFAALAAVNGAVPTHTLQNFAAMLALILGENYPNLQIGIFAVYLVSIVTSTELWWRVHHLPDNQNKFLKKCSATMLITLAASAFTAVQDYIALVPVFVWLWQATADDDTRETGRLVRKVLIAYPIVTWLYVAVQTAFPSLSIPVYFVWAVVLSVCTLPTLDVEQNNILNKRFKAMSSQ